MAIFFVIFFVCSPIKKPDSSTASKLSESSIAKSTATLQDESFLHRVNIGEKPEDAWILPNRTGFPRFISNKFSNEVRSNERPAMKIWSNGTSSNIKPFDHQKFVSDYLSDESPYRGLLLYHGLGSGKSGASITIAEGFRGRRILVLLPASLRRNYEIEI